MAYSIQRIHASDVISFESSLKIQVACSTEESDQCSTVFRRWFPCFCCLAFEIQGHLGWALVDLEQLLLFRSEPTSLNAICLCWRSPWADVRCVASTARNARGQNKSKSCQREEGCKDNAHYIRPRILILGSPLFSCGIRLKALPFDCDASFQSVED